MKTLLLSYVIALVAMLCIDYIWLMTMGPRFYKTHIGYIMAENVNYFAAIMMYVIYTFGVAYFIITPALEGEFSMRKVLMMGMLFGLVGYGAYDLTNHATIKGWPMIVTIVDMAWGSILTGAISCISYKIMSLKFFS